MRKLKIDKHIKKLDKMKVSFINKLDKEDKPKLTLEEKILWEMFDTFEALNADIKLGNIVTL